MEAVFASATSVGVVVLTGVATVGAAVLLGLAVAAYVRRRSRPYLLVVGAVAALLARSLTAGLMVAGLLSEAAHHLLEHALDVALVAFVVAAVYHARTVSNEPNP